MRAQPEDITDPEKTMITLRRGEWGSKYSNDTKVPAWSFSFTVAYEEVFSDGGNKLAFLLQDCDNVPMVTKLDEWDKVEGKLDTSDECKNIEFRIVDETQ